jgi:3-deoxy-D-manno-octulosonate 8-phosphate phosphatase (KDO 8-P phosphatase)
MVTRSATRAGRLDTRTLVARAKCVRLVITDCDGVLTDGGVYYSDAGEQMKRFSVRDGMGVERLRMAGIATTIVTGERSACVEKRAEKLGITSVYSGVRHKADLLERILADHGCGRDEVAGIGDDLNDLELLARVGAVGLTAAPADAMPEVLRAVQFWATRRGGDGAFREFAEWILTMRRGGTEPFDPVDF